MRLAVVVCLLVSLAACGGDPSTPEQRVRATLDAIEVGAEARSLSGVLDHVSERYTDHEGNVKKDIARIVQLEFIRSQSINIFTHIQSLEINGDTALVELGAAMAAREIDLSQEANRLHANTHHFSIVLHQQDKEWLVESVSWRRGWD